MHTSPLAQPGSGDGGGMNVYVRELATALARSGVSCDLYTRASDPGQPATVSIEPGLEVHHVPAGPVAPVPKELLPDLVDEFADGVMRRMADGTELIHANYWLSGQAGHKVKHALDLPLVSTFHTLARVKAAADEDEPARRAVSEADTVRCSDALLVSSAEEALDLVRLYQADADRIEIVPPGVEHAFFAPGDQAQARRAVGLPQDIPVLLFAGRIQRLKGLEVAVRAMALVPGSPILVVVGGPSGAQGQDELDGARELATRLGVSDRVRFVPPQPHELLSTYYRAADVSLVPSRSESFGLVALEAAACGTPVVASAVGGLRNLVEHGRTGFLVETRDPAAFAAAVESLLTDRWRAAEMSAEAAAKARNYTWGAAAVGLRQLYEKLTSRALVECR
ncbi:MAG TPA: glycosyltransferase [Acidimicrobiales bacterium]|nr:glycosyltransferase [Acidimicrobiales bacterium]